MADSKRREEHPRQADGSGGFHVVTCTADDAVIPIKEHIVPIPWFLVEILSKVVYVLFAEIFWNILAQYSDQVVSMTFGILYSIQLHHFSAVQNIHHKYNANPMTNNAKM